MAHEPAGAVFPDASPGGGERCGLCCPAGEGAICMTPLFFGSRARRLFGIYEPGRSGSRVPRAAVLCHPWGQEYIRAHRSMRRLANMLSATGRDTLRFDYFGTGDSAGDM